MLLPPLVAPPWLPQLTLLLLVPAVLVLCSCCAGCCPVLSCSLPDATGTCPVAAAGLSTLLLFPAPQALPLLVASCGAAAVGAPAGSHPAGPQPPVTWTSLWYTSAEDSSSMSGQPWCTQPEAHVEWTVMVAEV